MSACKVTRTCALSIRHRGGKHRHCHTEKKDITCSVAIDRFNSENPFVQKFLMLWPVSVKGIYKIQHAVLIGSYKK